jgi:hypothetical protein
VIAIGGDAPPTGNAVTTSEIWKSGAWSAGPALQHPRSGAQAIALSDDLYVVIGGFDASAYRDDAERCSISANTCTVLTGSHSTMTDTRANFTATRMGDGRWLIAGGYGSGGSEGYAASTDVFDPVSLTFSAGPRANAARQEHVAALLPNGRVMLAGGEYYQTLPDGGLPAVPAIEVIDVVAGRAMPAQPMPVFRYGASTATLSDGTILIAGGGPADFGGGLPIYATTDVYTFTQGGDGASCSGDGDCSSGVCTAGSCVGAFDAGAADAIGDGAIGDGASDAPSTSDVATDVPSDMPSDVTADAKEAAPPSPTPSPVKSGVDLCKVDADCRVATAPHCVDGVCCDQPCTGTCMSCALPATPGVCSPVPAGTDPLQQCGPVNSCVATCDGRGGCVTVFAGSECAPSRCTGPTSGLGPAFCADRMSVCDTTASERFECSPYICAAPFGACLAQCTSSDECATGYDCDLSSVPGKCVAASASSGGGCSIDAHAPNAATHPGALGASLTLLIVLAARTRRRRWA